MQWSRRGPRDRVLQRRPRAPVRRNRLRSQASPLGLIPCVGSATRGDLRQASWMRERIGSPVSPSISVISCASRAWMAALDITSSESAELIEPNSTASGNSQFERRTRRRPLTLDASAAAYKAEDSVPANTTRLWSSRSTPERAHTHRHRCGHEGGAGSDLFLADLEPGANLREQVVHNADATPLPSPSEDLFLVFSVLTGSRCHEV